MTRHIRSLAGAITFGALAALLTGTPAAHAAPPAPGQILLIDVTSPGVASINNEEQTERPSTSADGRYVAFTSNAWNLLPNPGGEPTIVDSHVFLRDTVLGTTTLLSKNDQYPYDPVHGHAPVISDDGRSVAFIGSSSLVTGFPAGGNQVYTYTVATGTVTPVSTSYISSFQGVNSQVLSLDLSGDGSTVVYETDATDVLPGDPYVIPRPRVYKVDLRTSSTTIVEQDPVLSASKPSVSADGRYVAFLSADSHTAITSGGSRQVYVRDTARSTELISFDGARSGASNGDAVAVDLSGDGRSVAFESKATNLLLSPTPAESHIYVHDRGTGVTSLESHDARSNPVIGVAPSITANGELVAYESYDGSASTHISQIFTRNRTSGLLSRASQNALPEAGNEPSHAPALSSTGRFLAWTSAATNLTGDRYPASPKHQAWHTLLRNINTPVGATRISGADRYETANAMSDATFPDGAATVFIASGETFPDALSGSVAAGAANAPLLLTERDSISHSTRLRIARLGPTRVVILGGPASVSPGVENALAAPGRTVERIGGADRYEVSANIAGATFHSASVVYVASGELAADSLSASAGAGQDSPVLLTRKDAVPAVVLDRLRALQPGRIVVVGGVSTIAESVLQQLSAVAPTSRVSGADRYETSAAVADVAFSGQAGGTVYIASGQQFPDALTASAAAITQDSPVLLVQDQALPSSIIPSLETLQPDRIVVLGGPLTISDGVVDQLSGYVIHRAP